jgi:hypothetical protein
MGRGGVGPGSFRVQGDERTGANVMMLAVGRQLGRFSGSWLRALLKTEN